MILGLVPERDPKTDRCDEPDHRQDVPQGRIVQDAVRIAVVKTGGRLPKVLETAEAPVSTLDEGEDLRTAQAEALRTAAADLSSPPAMYVLSLPASWAIIRQLSLPFRGRATCHAYVSRSY